MAARSPDLDMIDVVNEPLTIFLLLKKPLVDQKNDSYIKSKQLNGKDYPNYSISHDKIIKAEN